MADFSFTKTEAYKKFMAEHEKSDTLSLRLKNISSLPFDKEFAIIQIECLRKARNKIPELAESWIYPTNLSIEQCTPETIAKFNATLFAGCENATDYTCGLGIDAYYIAKNVGHLTAIDIDKTVADAATFNFQNAGADNITVINADSEEYAVSSGDRFSAAFIDQSRRGKENTRLYNINDCSPDIKKIIAAIREKTKFLIAKTSPMIDISDTLRQFGEITDVWVVALKNECKELLFKFDFTQLPTKESAKIHTLNFDNGKLQKFSANHNSSAPAPTAKSPQENDMIMLPNSSVMKAGIFNDLCANYGVCPISGNSHIFICGETESDLPGKIYKIKKISTLSKPDIKTLRQTTGQANIACRNFPMTPDELYKKLRIKPGGDNYIFATTTSSGKKILLICEKTTD